MRPYGKIAQAEISVYKKQPYQDVYDYIGTLDVGEYQIYDYNIVNGGYYHYLISAMARRNTEGSSQKYKYFIYDIGSSQETGELVYVHPRWQKWSICNIYEEDENFYVTDGQVWQLGMNLEPGSVT